MEKSQVFGLRCDASLASFDHQSSSWKMSQLSLFEDYPQSLESFPNSGMMRNGVLYPLETLELHTSASAGFVLPTPTASDPTKQSTGGLHRRIIYNQTFSMGDKRNKYPTPTAHLAKEQNCPSERRRHTKTLVSQLAKPGEKAIVEPKFVEWMMGFPENWTKQD